MDDQEFFEQNIRTVFLKEAPEGALADHFRDFCLGIWPEDQGEEMPVAVACQIVKYLTEHEDSVSPDGAFVLDMILQHSFSSVAPEVLSEAATAAGLTYDQENQELY